MTTYELADRDVGGMAGAVLYVDRESKGRRIFVGSSLMDLAKVVVSADIVFGPSELQLLPRDAEGAVAGDKTPTDQSLRHFRGVYSEVLRNRD